MILYPHAKVNLSLYITGRQPDGYHTIDTVFQPLTLRDRMELRAAAPGEAGFSCSVPELSNDQNLAVRAYERIKARCGFPEDYAIRLEKKIPSQAGLGGGSADAAALLRALNTRQKPGLSMPQLIREAASLGADVPALLREGPSRGRGTGTQLTPLGSRARLFFVIVKPEAACPTAEMYRAWDQAGRRRFSAAEIEWRQAALEEALLAGDAAGAAAFMHNDFEAVLSGEAAAAFRQISRLLEENGALKALLCGSGSAVLGLFADAKTRNAAARKLRAAGPWQVFSCENTREKPLSCSVILAAGGSGSRLGGQVNKILVPIGGETLLARSLKVFYLHPAVKQIVIPCRQTDREMIGLVLASLMTQMPFRQDAPGIELTDGGAERQDSVRNALALCREELVLIHDAARPFVKPRAVDDCLEALRDYPAVSLAVPSRDTVKLVNEDGEVTETTDRARTWLIQTPQGFRREALSEAHERFRDKKVTDDCALMELAGHPVKLVMGDHGNRKITVPSDI